jgi:streptomycin 6-kinase
MTGRRPRRGASAPSRARARAETTAPLPPLPDEFVHRVCAAFAPAGAPWLVALPTLVETTARRWGLEVAAPLWPLSYNYVAPARRRDGTPVVLKLGVPCAELTSKIAALWHDGGRGMARLLAADAETGALLLARLSPGTPPTVLAAADDLAATRVAASVMRWLWRPPPATHGWVTVADWMAGLRRLRARFGGGTGPFPAELVALAEAQAAALLPIQAAPVVLYDDLHHANILACGPGRWRAIDPKGVIGEPAYEAGALLHNPMPTIAADPQLGATLVRRIAVLAGTLDLVVGGGRRRRPGAGPGGRGGAGGASGALRGWRTVTDPLGKLSCWRIDQ